MERVNPTTKATIYDVAERAGVSISTVSLALNSPDRVKAATLERILGAADDLGYTPKAEAVLRARAGLGRVGVIAPFSSFPAENARRLNGVFAGLQAQGHEITVYDQASAATSKLVSLPVSRKVDGLIICSVPLDAEVRDRLLRRATPTVVIEIAHPGLDSVIIDHRGGGEMVGRFLAGRDHASIAYLGHQQDYAYPSQSLSKLEGFASALPAAPIVRNIPHDYDSAVAAGLELLDGPDAPTAVFAHDDLLASGVLEAARRLGRSVPDELEVVGFNDGELARPLGLTSLAQPFEESGEVAARLLVERLADRSAGVRTVTLGVTLVERSTTRAR